MRSIISCARILPGSSSVWDTWYVYFINWRGDTSLLFMNTKTSFVPRLENLYWDEIKQWKPTAQHWASSEKLHIWYPSSKLLHSQRKIQGLDHALKVPLQKRYTGGYAPEAMSGTRILKFTTLHASIAVRFLPSLKHNIEVNIRGLSKNIWDRAWREDAGRGGRGNVNVETLQCTDTHRMDLYQKFQSTGEFFGLVDLMERRYANNS